MHVLNSLIFFLSIFKQYGVKKQKNSAIVLDRSNIAEISNIDNITDVHDTGCTKWKTSSSNLAFYSKYKQFKSSIE